MTVPEVGEPEAQAARRAILSGWLTQGREVAAFEAEFAAAVQAPHACAVSNCTTALHLALQVAGVTPGAEVVTVSHSFIATANAIRYCGATPVFVDIDPRTFNIDPARLDAAITPRTRAVLCVHQMGLPCDLEAVVEVARAHRLPVVEDAACAIGSEIRWKGSWQPIGRPHGDVACFSFHPRKVITTGDGGMLTTRHAAWDRQFQMLRQHAMDTSDAVRHSAGRVIFERYPSLGYNYRMTDIQAAVGREQLKRLPGIVARRRALAARYARLLAPVAGLVLPVEPDRARTTWQSYCVRLPDHCDQMAVMQRLLDAGVASRRGIMCAHREQTCADIAPGWPLPHSEAAQDRCILLPLYPSMTDEDQRQVAAALRSACTAPLAVSAG